ncbi:tigger transposable element-derived protein 1 isoform X1 [Monomorium pharaonis]|uniref:tigger transposable element-derived protein 1 isoform X1 n=1 Tax=Monomorium pharaonis TaxID=307658 RepID=UPI00063F8458|nr:tigger transposable element-derived protein 1 isoform X1 [Monomorium pharaonis]XP_028049436.1 tigger transposable element-derived protein 1 isoform X1 [Monomorium pharaonis]XP_036148560.1 tigger transposable element-derived protein 1 isoform X1 [Monomorium pharaonis]XP_036148561.1 tigger transposable element-derived protein 1 isoform X1 [Monomorium pharaonis]XP_036148562.1 tigger transposable element-derived protein 1 isoform X1 [Monomorium pharaonis]XP_036148563.1 tigger transposable eleme
MTSIKGKEKENLMPQRQTRRKWDPQNMAKAIEAVRNKEMGVHKASKKMHVPKSTLQRLVNMKYCSPKEAMSCKIGRSPVFNVELEKELVEYCLTMEKLFYGLTRNDLRYLALQLAIKNDIKHPFNGMAGKKWLTYFLQRHPSLLHCKRTKTSFAGKERFNETNVNKFFDLLDAAFNEYNYPADRIFNVDALGLTVLPSKTPQIIVRKGTRQINAITLAERNSLITVISSMNAAGTFIPPMIIFPEKNNNTINILMKGAPPSSIGDIHPSGWVQNNLFTKWLKHFISKTKPSKDDPVLLLFDGCHSYVKNIDLINLSREQFIKIISFPPHTTHKLQPLDKSFMDPLKTYYLEQVKTWIRITGLPITHYNVMNLFGRAYIKCQTAQIAINGFRETGVYPPNRNVFFNANYLTFREENKEIKEETQSENVSILSRTQAHLCASNETVSVDSDTLNKASCSTIFVEPQPSISCDISPFDIISISPKRRKVSIRGRKSFETQVTLHQEKLQHAIKEKEHEQIKRGRSRGKNRERGRGKSRGKSC